MWREHMVCPDDGGEIAVFLASVDGLTFTCNCERVLQATATSFDAYPHDGGLADGSGKRWWLYMTCPKCGYGVSYTKVKGRAQILTANGGA